MRSVRRTRSPGSFSHILLAATGALIVAASPAAPTANAQPTIGAQTAPAGSVKLKTADPVGAAAAPCGDETIREVRRTVRDPVSVACSLTLDPNWTITRTIEFGGNAASGATLQCACDTGGCATLQGGINIFGFGTDRPENITVRNCTITGDVHLIMPDTCPDATDRSLCPDTRPDFVEWIRARAPRRITFDNVRIAGTGKNRFYVGQGVTETKLINSVIEGEATGVPIYLAPHSGGALIKNNQIRTVTRAPGAFRITEREAISIDGSDHNRIISNWFGALNRGGIYVYRNCGENGGIRHTTPSHNHIVNNAFPYVKYDGPNPAVFLGSRDGDPPGGDNYCDDDEGPDGRFPFGSSADNRDFATHNVVMQNWIVKRAAGEVIKSKNWVNNAMNLIDRNKTVTENPPWPLPPAGCYVRGGEKEFILHGETTEKFMDDEGSPICERVTCQDGELRPALLIDSIAPPNGVVMREGASPLAPRNNAPAPRAITPAPRAAAPDTRESAASVCKTRRVPIDCQINGDNKGCHQTVYCPTGTKVVGAVAACNLENGAVSDAELATVPPHLIHVARLSDDIEDGGC